MKQNQHNANGPATGADGFASAVPDRSARRRRAWKTTALVAMICAVPLAIKHWLTETYGMSDPQAALALEPFVLTGENGDTLTRHDLFSVVHLAIHRPQQCDDGCFEPAREIIDWSRQQFVKKLEGQDTKTMRVLIFTDRPEDFAELRQAASAFDAEAGESSLRFFPAAQFADLIPAANEGGQGGNLALAVIDQHAELIRYASPLNSADLPKLKARLSKASFNHYLDDYLAKRTFFGPRREKEANQNPPGTGS